MKPPFKVPRVEVSDQLYLERDPAKRKPIWEYQTSKEQNEIRKNFLQKGPYTWYTAKYPFDQKGRKFCSSWFKLFPDWLEYSPTTNAAYCLPCILYAKPSGRQRENAFTIEGFRSLNKVNGKDCAFLKHIGRDHNSTHKDAVKKCNDLLRMEQHIDTLIDNITPEIIERNRLKLKVSIVAVRWLAFQHCAFRGHDESVGSLNRASFSKDVEKVVLENAPGNASYTSHQIQQEILSIYSGRIRDVILNEIGDQKEQMTVVLRFVDKNGYIQERLFYLIHGAIEECLLAHKLNIENIRGQGYDGASNMRGEWSGLQALFLNECPYAYYVHCFAHRLQLALIAASRDVISVYQFFSKLTFIVNIITSSAKRHDQLQTAHLAVIERLLELEELETRKGKNQIGTVKRAGDTRWGSHFGSLNSLLNMYNASCSVLQTVIKEGKSAQRGEADKAYDDMTSFEFVPVLHIMIQILGITNDLCQALQRKSQDILNAMHLVSNTKILIQKLRDDGWENLLQQVLLFCNNHDIEVPNMEDHYIYGRGRFRQPKDCVTNLHYFRYDVFIAAINSQLHELDFRFNDEMIELLSLSSSLDPKRNFKADDIYKLVSKFYPADFTEQEKLNLKSQSDLFLLEIKEHPQLDSLKSISDLCRWLGEIEKGEIYYLIDRLVRLVLTLPVSTATAERPFSAMKLIKTALRNRMEDDYLTDSLIVYVEKGIAKEFDIDSIIDEFASKKDRRSLLMISKTNK
ncbi:hypothetical protein RND81_12G063600 [Saponaria officinalis]|uniref:TTF-type domain-containing protein n=1 Tax=Saponaria officinalis TaxID=3572 RepID=A0AAW1H5Q1_SAPOF